MCCLGEATLWAYPTLSTLRVSASLEVIPAGPALKEALISQDLSRQSWCLGVRVSLNVAPSAPLLLHPSPRVCSLPLSSVTITYKHIVARAVENQTAKAGDAENMDLIPRSERPPEGGHGNPLQYSCLGNPTDRGAWQATVHGEAKTVGHD